MHVRQNKKNYDKPLIVYAQKVSKRKSFADFIDDHSVTKLFLQNHLCTRRIGCCERVHYENIILNIP